MIQAGRNIGIYTMIVWLVGAFAGAGLILAWKAEIHATHPNLPIDHVGLTMVVLATAFLTGLISAACYCVICFVWDHYNTLAAKR